MWVITHDMNTARKVADRIVMVYPLPRLREDEPQILLTVHPATWNGVKIAACNSS